jgi:ribokinase
VIAVFGSFNVDVYVHGVEALGPAGAIITVDRHDVTAGGKGGNQAVAVARAGVPAAAFGCVGADPLGAYLLEQLTGAGVDAAGVERSRDRATGTGLLFLDRTHDHRVVYARGANAAASARQLPDAALAAAQLLLLQGDVVMAENERLVERAAAAGTPVVLTLGPDTSMSFDALRQVRYAILNERELGLFVDRCRSALRDAAIPSPGDGPRDGCRWMRQTFGCATVVTRGARGAVGCDHGGDLFEAQALDVAVEDTVGAGDVLAGYFAAAVAEGSSFPHALGRGVVAASLSCRHLGAQRACPARAEVDAVVTARAVAREASEP